MSYVARETFETGFDLEVYIFYINCAHLVRASLNSLYIPNSVLHVVEISTALV